MSIVVRGRLSYKMREGGSCPPSRYFDLLSESTLTVPNVPDGSALCLLAIFIKDAYINLSIIVSYSDGLSVRGYAFDATTFIQLDCLYFERVKHYRVATIIYEEC
jgi:hypothetical protein